MTEHEKRMRQHLGGTALSMLRGVRAFATGHQDISFTLCLVLVTVVLTWSVVTGQASMGPEQILDSDPLHEDAGPQTKPVDFADKAWVLLDFPRDLAFARGLQDGRIDLWNPEVGFGQPLWAEQGAPFFPLKAFFFAAPSAYTYNLFLVLRFLLAAIGAYILARGRGLEPAYAFCAAALFETSGCMVAQASFGTAGAMCMLPWLLVGARLIADNRGWVAMVVTSGVVFLAWIGGHPTIGGMVLLAFGVAVAGHALSVWRQPKQGFFITGKGLVALAIGTCLAAIVILPLLELRDVAITYKDTPLGDAIWTRRLLANRTNIALTTLVPGMIPELRASGWPLWPWSVAPAVGIVTLVLATIGIAKRGIDLSLAAVALLGVVLTLMPPGLAWVHDLPGVGLILPIYAWPLIALPMTQAAGRGVRTMSEPEIRKWVVLTLGLVLIGVLWLVFDRHGRSFEPILSAAISRSGYTGVFWPLVLAAFAMSLGCMLTRTRFSHYGVGLIIICAIVEMLSIMTPMVGQPPSTVLSAPPSPAVETVRSGLADGQGRFHAVPATLGHANTLMLSNIPDLRSIAGLPVSRYVDYLSAIGRRQRSATLHASEHLIHPLLDLAAVRYVAVTRTARTRGAIAELEQDPSSVLAHEGRSILVFENLAALPRVRVAHRAIHASNRTAARTKLGLFGNSGHISRERNAQVIVEPSAAGVLPRELSTPNAPSRDDVRIVDRSDPDRLVIDATLEHPGYLVVADTYYPGWRVRVDGIVSEIYPANVAFRAVYLPAGRHRVAFEFHPESMRHGGWIFLVTCLFLVALVFWMRHRAR